MKLIILCFTILFLPLSLSAEGTDFTIEGGTPVSDYEYKNDTCTILTSTKLTISGTTTTDNIIIKKGVTANIVLNSINISLSNVDGKSAIDLKENATLNLTLTGTSTLTSGNAVAGIHLSNGSNLIITAESDGHSLTVTGGNNSNNNGYSGAGIGKNPQEEGNATLKIEGGNVTANGGEARGYRGTSGDGIGKNVKEGLSHLTIDITGGSVVANGGYSLWTSYGGNGINGIVRIKGGSVTARGKSSGFDITGNVTIEGGTITDCVFRVEVIIKSGTFTNCTFYGETTVQGGTFTKCRFERVAIIKSGTFTNSYFGGETTVLDGTFTNSTFSGKSFLMNKGTINNTDGNNISAKNITIQGGTIEIQLPQKNNTTSAIEGENILISGGNINVKGGSDPDNANGGAGIKVHKNNTLTITGGYLCIEGGRDCAGIGGRKENDCGTVIIKGGTIKVIKGPSGGSSSIGGGYANENNGTLNIAGGSLYTSGDINATIENGVLLGITPDIANATDVSVDGKPYYISGNHDGYNKLYLYMTGEDHTITVRTSDNNITTYQATYKSDGVDGDGAGKGYFIFDSGSLSTPDKNSSVAFNSSNYEMIYGTDNLTVILTVTNKATKTRSAAMNSVQLTLIDEEKTVLLSDEKDVIADGEYEFVFDANKLNVGTYTLTAQYGGSSESKTSDKVDVPLTIIPAEGTKAPEYTDPDPTATYKDKLSDIQLPTGWTWNESDIEIEVGSVGVNTFAAIFTPADISNYKVVSKNLSVTVNPLLVSKLDDPKVISPELVTYGVKLSEIKITDGWEWKDGNTLPEVWFWDGYPAYYEIKDYINYDWSNISGYNESLHQVIRNIRPNVEKAYLDAKDFIFTPPENLIYDGEGKEAKVEVRNKNMANVDIYITYYDIDKNTVYGLPKDLGTYTVSISFYSLNYAIRSSDLTDPDWTFSIKEQHNITIASSIVNGTVTADKEKATEGETIILKVNPASGYELESLFYTQLSDGATIPITNKRFVMPESDVTVTAMFKEKSVDPTPVYYTITLPAIEGAITNPPADRHEVKERDDFGFYLAIEDGYRESSVPVVTADGDVITPRMSDGKYIIQYIREDINIEISGIIPDNDTANASLSSGFGISTSDGILCVTVPYATRMYLTDTVGRLLLSRQLSVGDTYIEGFAVGVYVIIFEGQKGKKILLK
ncbi:InlB B-repeat-containing protein [Parabacteroides timonensis]|uniref:InlB B-repeat-containing protein n=1 Tax=Parabacteroides timonensis TaxID=1871013 RepID=UPI00094E630A|nr:hypothetical protein [Parabacteroides timonensis]